jgi:hypothetical protein
MQVEKARAKKKGREATRPSHANPNPLVKEYCAIIH